MKNYFGFIDESGNSRQERFFGLGLLLIDDEIGSFYDAMKPFYDRAYELAKLIKSERIKKLKEEGDIKQIAEIANSNRRFELKFSYINNTNSAIYSALVRKYFEFKNIRFCALIIDRHDPKFPYTDLEPWNVYIHRAAMLVANNIKNIHPCNLCLLADDLTKPKNIHETFELSLKNEVQKRLAKITTENKIFGVSRLQSHSSLLLQMVDILLGSVMYDFKKECGLISEKQAKRQDAVVDVIRKKLSVKSLHQSNTFNKPNYFSVWKFQKQYKHKAGHGQETHTRFLI